MKIKLSDGTEFEGTIAEYQCFKDVDSNKKKIIVDKEVKEAFFGTFSTKGTNNKEINLNPLILNKNRHTLKNFKLTSEQQQIFLSNLHRPIHKLAKILDVSPILFNRYVYNNGGIKKLRNKYSVKLTYKHKKTNIINPILKLKRTNYMKFVNTRGNEYRKEYGWDKSKAYKQAVLDYQSIQQQNMNIEAQLKAQNTEEQNVKKQ